MHTCAGLSSRFSNLYVQSLTLLGVWITLSATYYTKPQERKMEPFWYYNLCESVRKRFGWNLRLSYKFWVTVGFFRDLVTFNWYKLWDRIFPEGRKSFLLVVLILGWGVEVILTAMLPVIAYFDLWVVIPVATSVASNPPRYIEMSVGVLDAVVMVTGMIILHYVEKAYYRL